MYHCHDIDIPRLYVAHPADLEKGVLDADVQPGFECFFSPRLDLDTFDVRKVVQSLIQRGCAHVATPIGVIKDMRTAKVIQSAPFTREFVDTYPFKHLAEKTTGAMERDVVFLCEEDTGDRDSSVAELFTWVYGEHHPFGVELVNPSALSFQTPLGDVTATGPTGPVPFRVTKLLNRHYAYGKTRSVFMVDDLYEIEIDLDELEDGTEYYVGCEGTPLSLCDSDERTECYTCTRDGIVFGIGVYDPSDDWDNWPDHDPSRYEGYSVESGHLDRVDRPICIIPTPLGRDRVKKAVLWVGWIEAWKDEREPWTDAEDLLSFCLT